MKRFLKKIYFFFLLVSLFFPDYLLSQNSPLVPFSLVYPLMGPQLSSSYGMRRHPIIKYMNKQHSGVDLAAPAYSHVRAVAKGRVVYADRYAGYGKLVTIVHDSGWTSIYGHLNEIRVNTGQNVTAGQIIGRLGSTGMSTGPHLHFEWRKDNVPVDPLKVLPTLASEASG